MAIHAGTNRETAAAKIGIAAITLRAIIKRDKEFSARVHGADAEAKYTAEQSIFHSRDWKAKKAWLAARYPEEWAEKQKVDHSHGSDPEKPVIVRVKFDD